MSGTTGFHQLNRQMAQATAAQINREQLKTAVKPKDYRQALDADRAKAKAASQVQDDVQDNPGSGNDDDDDGQGPESEDEEE